MNDWNKIPEHLATDAAVVDMLKKAGEKLSEPAPAALPDMSSVYMQKLMQSDIFGRASFNASEMKRVLDKHGATPATSATPAAVASPVVRIFWLFFVPFPSIKFRFSAHCFVACRQQGEQPRRYRAHSPRGFAR